MRRLAFAAVLSMALSAPVQAQEEIDCDGAAGLVCLVLVLGYALEALGDGFQAACLDRGGRYYLDADFAPPSGVGAPHTRCTNEPPEPGDYEYE